MSKYIWAFPEGALANMARGIYDEQIQATLVDRTVTKIAKAMSLQPPTVIVTPPPPEHSARYQESHVVEEGGRPHQAASAMTAECRAREGDYATPAGLLDQALVQEGLEQCSLDGRVHREEKREKNRRDTREFFEEEALKMDAVKPPPESESDLPELATGSKSAREEGSSPQTHKKIRKANGGISAPKSREDDGWVKVKAPPKASPIKDDWEFIDADESDEEWTLV
ncbi:hypothetical protein G7Y79_00012g033300 [Physcia stellaris]|nr:hypothetical protein G7Y79_00012g033300 [Physcia stellaris]